MHTCAPRMCTCVYIHTCMHAGCTAAARLLGHAHGRRDLAQELPPAHCALVPPEAYVHACIHAHMHTYSYRPLTVLSFCLRHTCMHACMHTCIHRATAWQLLSRNYRLPSLGSYWLAGGLHPTGICTYVHTYIYRLAGRLHPSGCADLPTLPCPHPCAGLHVYMHRQTYNIHTDIHTYTPYSRHTFTYTLPAQASTS